MLAGEVVVAVAAGVAVVVAVPVDAAGDGAVTPVPAAVPDVAEFEGRLEVPDAVPDAELPVAEVPLELSVADGVAALGAAVEVAGVLLVVALSVDEVDAGADWAFAMPARASAAEPIKSFCSSLDMLILL